MYTTECWILLHKFHKANLRSQARTHTHAHTHTHTPFPAEISYIRVLRKVKHEPNTHTQTHTHTHTHTHAHTHALTHARTHARTHIRTKQEKKKRYKNKTKQTNKKQRFTLFMNVECVITSPEPKLPAVLIHSRPASDLLAYC